MPTPSRDRLARPVDISALYRGAARRVDLIVDQPGLTWTGLSGDGSRNVSGGGSVSGRRAGIGRGWYTQRQLQTGQENRTPRMMAGRRYGGARGRGSRLPSWYPRTPLRDITAIVRAIERRRAELNRTTEATEEQTNTETATAPNAEPEQEIGSQTPLPTISVKPQPSPATKVWQITPRNADNNETGSDFMTPQKRLLHSIEKVREVWLEDRKKLEKTPAAKRAEREKKVRTLMSMR
ncbi:protein POLYCHOME-like [Chenopodium quinoa]|uniref:protein POLYCHOME-like n=1 Tax=Chenopodium quinoa TaxID=63459 RepID=UPI000B76F928|nr:protein POLYCHOME-like [Chenopodium quinoa]